MVSPSTDTHGNTLKITVTREDDKGVNQEQENDKDAARGHYHTCSGS